MVRSSLITICALSFTLGFSQAARACECSLDSERVEGVFARADVVFSGKVIKVTSVKMASVGLVMLPSGSVWKTFEDEERSATLEVTEAFKGVSGRTIEVITSVDSSGSCGVGFKEGESYLVYADKRHPYLSSDETKLPEETRTPEVRLKAEADRFNEGQPILSTSICSRTGHLRYREADLAKIRLIIKSQPRHEEQKQIRKPLRITSRAMPNNAMQPTANQRPSHRELAWIQRCVRGG